MLGRVMVWCVQVMVVVTSVKCVPGMGCMWMECLQRIAKRLPES